jgi:hypothetical protein
LSFLLLIDMLKCLELISGSVRIELMKKWKFKNPV